MTLGLTRRAPLLVGVAIGVASVFLVRACVNATPFADWFVARLLIPDSPGTADAIVVLGAGVSGPCEPNLNSLRRVMKGVGELRSDRGPFLLMTGGTGGPGCKVAEAMAGFARELGVGPSQIHVEGASRNTYENGVFSAGVLRGWGVRRVLLVTDQLHMARASAVYAGLGFDVITASVPIYESHENNSSMLTAGIREYLALGFYRVRGRMGPASHPRSPIVTPTNVLPPIRPRGDGPVVLLGASYAAGWPFAEVGGVPVLNRGVAGAETHKMLERFERDVVAARPRAVVLWGFINDVFRTTSGDMDTTLARVRENYTRMIAIAREHDIEPILATEVTARPSAHSLRDRFATLVGQLRGKPSYQDQINVHVQANNAWLVELAEREGLLLIDLQQALAEPGGRRHPTYAQPDGSHITPAGYDALTTFARPILEAYLVGR